MRIQPLMFSLIASFCFLACGEIGTGVGNPPTPSTKAAAAVAGLFNSESDASLNAALRAALVSTPRQVQAEFCSRLNSSPGSVNNAAFTDPGTFGSAEISVSLTDDDFCTQPDGTVNDPAGPDGIGVYGAFELNSDIDAVCTSPEGTFTVTMNTGSRGVFRNTDATSDDPAYFPQIYGLFSVSSEGDSSTVHCTMFLLEDQTVDFASCTDQTDTVVTQDSDVTCQINSQ